MHSYSTIEKAVYVRVFLESLDFAEEEEQQELSSREGSEPWHAERAREQCEHMMETFRRSTEAITTRQLSQLTAEEVRCGVDYAALLRDHVKGALDWFQAKLNG